MKRDIGGYLRTRHIEDSLTAAAARAALEGPQLRAGFARTVAITTGNYTAGASASTDYIYLIAGAHTTTMPTAIANANIYTLKNNHSANVTVGCLGGQTIDGAATITLAPGNSVDLISDGATWRIT